MLVPYALLTCVVATLSQPISRANAAATLPVTASENVFLNTRSSSSSVVIKLDDEDGEICNTPLGIVTASAIAIVTPDDAAPIIAGTSCSLINALAADLPTSGSVPLSRCNASIRLPFTPPASFTNSKANDTAN